MYELIKILEGCDICTVHTTSSQWC